MPATVHYFGIRHHGPGCARCLDTALRELAPAMVLVEGPEDATDLMPLLGDADMEPPVALLAYATENPDNAIFWPFALFSPEYRAARYALDNQVPLRLIDLPAAATLAEHAKLAETPDYATGTPAEGEEKSDNAQAVSEHEPEGPVSRDPIGILARCAGYEDGESWWSDLVEENPEPGPLFAAIASAMTALRGTSPAGLSTREARREAHMRLAIDHACKEVNGSIAVICGAWHVPALQTPQKRKDDRELLRGLPKVKASLTWAPWTQPRLASASGYGAGIRHPGWYEHLWHHGGETTRTTRWLLRIARLMRNKGHPVSTASLIDAERLTTALAAIRNRTAPNFEELRDAAVACLCGGESLLYATIGAELLTGAGVGRVSARTPLSPLLSDLQTQQKTAKLKPAALERELPLDLRSESGLFRSTLLHRLVALEIPWGKPVGAGRSRGTFRENWMLRWEPEYAVRLVEQLVHGPTIEQAASGCLLASMRRAESLARLAEYLEKAMKARLPAVIDEGSDLLGRKAAHTSDCAELLNALTPMAELLRYGEARTGTQEHLGGLMRQIALQSFVGLPYAARNLDANTAAELGEAMANGQRALQLAEFPAEDLHSWHKALREVVEQAASTPFVSGFAARLLYEGKQLSPEEAALLLQRRLSPGTVTSAAAGYFEGFLTGMAERLIQDRSLLDAVDKWLMGLDEADWLQNLPLFRRVFSQLDGIVRNRLVQTAVHPDGSGNFPFVPAPNQQTWEEQFSLVTSILKEGAPR